MGFNCFQAKLVLAMAGLCLGRVLQRCSSGHRLHGERRATNSFLTEATVATSSLWCCTALPGAEGLYMSQSQAGVVLCGSWLEFPGFRVLPSLLAAPTDSLLLLPIVPFCPREKEKASLQNPGLDFA